MTRKQQERQQAQADKIQSVKIQKIADKASVTEDDLRGKSAKIHPAGQSQNMSQLASSLLDIFFSGFTKSSGSVYISGASGSSVQTTTRSLL